jgi:hypothetical protein
VLGKVLKRGDPLLVRVFSRISPGSESGSVCRFLIAEATQVAGKLHFVREKNKWLFQTVLFPVLSCSVENLFLEEIWENRWIANNENGLFQFHQLAK